MPLMFIIAGYAHGMKEHFSSGQTYSYYFRKYIIDLYLPCMFFSLIYWLPKYILSSSPVGMAEGLIKTNIEGLFMIPFLGFSAYWFLCTLFFVKMLHLLFERYVKSESLHFVFWLLMYAAAVVLFLRGNSYNKYVFYLGIYFHMGFMMKRHNLIPKKFSLGIILLFAGAAFFCASKFYGRSNIFLHTGSSICTSLALFIIFYALDIRNRFLVTCGVYSMVIYCLHDWILSSSRVIYRFTGLSSSANIFVLFMMSFICAVFIPLIIVWVYKHVKCLRWVEYIFYPGRFKRDA